MLTQGLIEAGGSRGDGNVRCLFDRDAVRRVLDDAGWLVRTEQTVDSTGMQDADWEIAACLAYAAAPPGWPR